MTAVARRARCAPRRRRPSSDEPAEHLVRAARQRSQARAGVAVVAGLAEQRGRRRRRRCRRRARSRPAGAGDRPRLAARVLDHDHRRVALGQLLDARRRRPRTRARAPQDLPPPRRRRGEDEPHGSRAAADGRVRLRPSSGNQIAISRSADSSESEPWTRLKVTSSAEVAADRAGRGLDRVGRADQLAGGRDGLDALEDRATSGPPVMKATSSPKNGFSVCSA